MFFNVVPKFTNIFNYFKFITSKNFKTRLKQVKFRCIKITEKNLSNKFFNKKSLIKLNYNLTNFSKFFVSKNFFFKNILKFEVSFLNFKSLVKGIEKFSNFSSVILKFRNLSKSCYYSKALFFDFNISQNYQPWYYYFLIMRIFGSSSCLLGSCLKNLIETSSLRKKQLFFLRNLKGFLISYFRTKLFRSMNGIKILVTGRINGRSRASFYKFQVGSLPFSTFSQKISYTFIPAFNVYGSYGIKVWIAYV